jgi:uncharacterized protein (TIGR03437 family)
MRRIVTALFAALGLAATGAEIPALEARVTDLNRKLLGIAGPSPAAEGIVAERAAALRTLIQRDPARALSLALPEPALGALRRAYPSLASSLEERGEWSGPITELIADDFERHASRRLIWMRVAEGELDLRFASGEPPHLKTGDRARVRGTRLGMTVAAVEASVTAPAAAAGTCETTGEQKIAALMVAFSGQKPDMTPDDLRQMLFGTSGRSLDGYWREASYGQTWATGDVIGPLDLNGTFTCEGSDSLAAAALNAASRQIDLSQYNRVFIYFPGPCDSYLGLGTVGCYGGFSTAWFPITGALDPEMELSVAAHEGGHNFGLNEVKGRQYFQQALGAPNDSGTRTTYYDPFTTMGNFIGWYGHYNARQKWQLGWLGADQVTTVEQPGAYRIAPLGSSTGGPKALRIRRGDLDAWLWAEYRQPSGLYESSFELLPQVYTGALIHYEDIFNQDSGFYAGATDLLDFTPGSQSTNAGDFLDPALAAGQRWDDQWTPQSIAVTGADPDGLSIQVSQDSCVSLSASSAFHGGGEETGSVQVTAPSGCQWQVLVSPAQSWITLTSAASGTGSGAVSYRVAAMTTPQVRLGTLSVGRRTFQITQAALNLPPTGVAVFPPSGAGYVQTFTFAYSDLNGPQDIARPGVEFRDSGGGRVCSLFVDTAAGSAGLQDEFGPLLPGALGSTTPLENQHCALNLAGISWEQAGGQLLLRVPMTFKPEFDGLTDVRPKAFDRAGAFGLPITLGQWMVGALPGPAPVIATAGVVNAASYQGGAVAPGEIVAIFGTGLGPAQIAYARYDAAGLLGNFAGGTTVFFDGVQAPVIYALDGQVSAIVPYSVASSTKVRVEYQGRRSTEVTLPVAAAAPGIFRYPSSTRGVVVQETGLNSDQLPVERGKVVWFYVTGEGQTVPAGKDGRLPVAPNWPVPAGNLSVTFGDKPGTVDFKGLVYAGVLQLNVWVPADAPVGSNVPLTVKLGGVSSTATMAVK